MSLSPIPTSSQIASQGGLLTALWQGWMESINYWLRPIGQSGTTTNRPVDSSRIPLYVGQTYFDTTLGKPIWVKSRNPTVWCDATGGAV